VVDGEHGVEASLASRATSPRILGASDPRRPTRVMTPAQLRAALAAQLHRLAGAPDDDKVLDVTVDPPNLATVDLERTASLAPAKVRKARGAPAPPGPKRSTVAPRLVAASSALATAPVPQRSARLESAIGWPGCLTCCD
jgi:hypothetical protein